jgi:hypothetical protein
VQSVVESAAAQPPTAVRRVGWGGAFSVFAMRSQSGVEGHAPGMLSALGVAGACTFCRVSQSPRRVSCSRTNLGLGIVKAIAGSD